MIRIDMQQVTLGQLSDASELVGGSITDALQGGQRERAIMTLAYVVKHDEDPTFTMDDARRIPFAELRVVNADAEGEANAVGNGVAPPLSPASGG